MIFWKPKIALSTANRIFFQIRNGNRLSWRFPPCLPFSLSLSLSVSIQHRHHSPPALKCIYIFFFGRYTCLATHDWFVVVLVIYGCSPGSTFVGAWRFLSFRLAQCPWVAAIKMINDLVGLSHKMCGKANWCRNRMRNRNRNLQLQQKSEWGKCNTPREHSSFFLLPHLDTSITNKHQQPNIV